jgi:hypothetical protein
MGCTVVGGLLGLLLDPLQAVSLLPYIPKDGVFVRENQGKKTSSEASPGSEAGYTLAVDTASFRARIASQCLSSSTSGPRRNSTFENTHVGVPTDLMRHFGGHWKGEWGLVMPANRARRIIRPRNRRGGSVGLSKRIQDQMGVQKCGNKDNDKAGEAGECKTRIERGAIVHGMAAGIPERSWTAHQQSFHSQGG